MLCKVTLALSERIEVSWNNRFAVRSFIIDVAFSFTAAIKQEIVSGLRESLHYHNYMSENYFHKAG